MLFLFLFFILPPVLHPAPNQLVQSMADGVRVTFSRPSRPPNIPSPPPLIPTSKPTDKPSFIQGGSISQVRHQGVMAKVYWWLSGLAQEDTLECIFHRFEHIGVWVLIRDHKLKGNVLFPRIQKPDLKMCLFLFSPGNSWHIPAVPCCLWARGN